MFEFFVKIRYFIQKRNRKKRMKKTLIINQLD